MGPLNDCVCMFVCMCATRMRLVQIHALNSTRIQEFVSRMLHVALARWRHTLESFGFSSFFKANIGFVFG